MTDEKLIEAEVFKIESTHHFHGETCLCGFSSARSRSRTEHITGLVRAVFEKAHTPTDDEREALARIVRRVIDSAYTFEGDLDPSVDEILIRELLTAGFRRTVQGEPTDAQVEAAAVGYNTFPEEWERMSARGQHKSRMRAALRAAAAVREEGR